MIVEQEKHEKVGKMAIDLYRCQKYLALNIFARSTVYLCSLLFDYNEI